MIEINENITYKSVTVSGAVCVIDVSTKKLGSGMELIARLTGIYISDAARQADPVANRLEHGWPNELRRNYDRATESDDILQLAHEMWRGFFIDPELGNFDPANVNITGL